MTTRLYINLKFQLFKYLKFSDKYWKKTISLIIDLYLRTIIFNNYSYFRLNIVSVTHKLYLKTILLKNNNDHFTITTIILLLVRL